MNEEILEKSFNVYSLYKDTPYIKIIDKYLNELFEQSFLLNKELLTFDYDINYKSHLTLSEIIKISKDFLKTINPKYSYDLENAINHGNIEFYYDDEYDEENNLSNGAYCGIKDIYSERTNTTNSFKTMHIPVKNNIDDVCTLIHEFFHMTNLNIEYESHDRMILTESVSITYEFLLMDYLIKNNICKNENVNFILVRLNYLLKESQYLNYSLTVFKEVKKNIDTLINNNFNDEKEKEIIRKDYINVRETLKYYLGTVIAILNYKRFKEGLLTTQEIENYNYSITGNEELKSLDVLFYKFPSIEETKEAVDFIKNEIRNVQETEVKI